MQTVAVLGIGEDGLDGLRAEARRTVEEAEVLVGGERHQRLLPEHPAQRVVFKRDAVHLAEDVEGLLDDGKRVVVLASGDPVYFGIGPLLVERLGAQRVRIFPNVGAVQLAFARLGLAGCARLLRARPPARARCACRAELSQSGHPDGCAAHSGCHRPGTSGGGCGTGWPKRGAWSAWAAQQSASSTAPWLNAHTGPQTHGTLAECAHWTADPLNVLVIVRNAAGVRGLALSIGLPEDDYAHARGKITKADVRVLSLVRLAPRSGDIIWDIGAGSGSVSIEAAGLCASSGVVYAVEKRAEQVACVRENIRRYGVTNVELVAGEAPDALAGLPDPDAVFVGGSGGRLESILETCLARLRPGGRLVLNMATLEGVNAASTFLKIHELPFELMQVSSARATSIGDGTRLAPLNPVFIVSARVPAP